MEKDERKDMVEREEDERVGCASLFVRQCLQWYWPYVECVYCVSVET